MRNTFTVNSENGGHLMLHPLILGLNIVHAVVLVAGRVSSVPILSEP